jgi:4-oxalocrotonate tautomerase
MPFARLTLFPAPSAAVAARLAAGLTDLIATALRKQSDLTSVLIEAPGGSWTIGGQVASATVHLEVTVTAGTNSVAEKSQFLASAMAILRSELPDLPDASYCVVREVAATDWGYDGKTQADRAVAAR